MSSRDDGSFVSTIDSDVERENIDEIVALPASARVMHMAQKTQRQNPHTLERVESVGSHAPAASVPRNKPREIPEIRSPVAPEPTLDGSETKDAAHRRGFESLAEHMIESQGHEAVVFRRFDDVNLKLLMGYERRIAALQGRLRVAEETNLEGDNEEEIESLERQLGKAMEQYYEKMILTKRILELEKPRKRALESTRRRFWSEDSHDSSVLHKYYKPRIEDDLVCLGSPNDTNWVSRWMENIIDDAVPRRVSAFLSAMCAVVFLVGAMIGLFFVSNERVRLGMIAVFTVLFALTIAMLTNTRKQDIFVATAAYAAVLVVFVSGNIAANPEPTICVLSDTNGETGSTAGTGALGSADNKGSQAVTVTATAVQTVTASPTGSMQTVFSTVMETVTATPSVAPKKQQLDDVSKAGVGIGVAIGALLVVVLVVGMAAWMRNRVRFGKPNFLSNCVCGRRKKKLSKHGERGGARAGKSAHDTGRHQEGGHPRGKETAQGEHHKHVTRETWV